MSDDFSKRSRALGRTIGSMAAKRGIPDRLGKLRKGLSAAGRSLADSATSAIPTSADRPSPATPDSSRLAVHPEAAPPAAYSTPPPSPATGSVAGFARAAARFRGGRRRTVAPAPVPGAPVREPRRGASRMDALAILILVACAVWLHHDGLFGGPAFYELDTRLFYFPLADWLSQQLHAGTLPLWQPQMFTGYPLFADGELGLAYIPQLLLLATLPTAEAMVWLQVLHVILAGLFTSLYLRALNLDPLPAVGGGLIFAFGSFLTAQMHHENVVRSAVWLPAVIACAQRVLRNVGRRRITWIAVGALAMGQAALGLHVQPMLMIAVALAVYGLYGVVQTRERAWRPLVWVGAIAGLGLVVAAVQLGPLLEWARVSSRGGGVDYDFASAFEMAPPALITLIFPYFFRLPDATTWWSLWQQWEIELYVGIPTLALIVVGLVFGRRRETLFLVALGAIALFVAMGQHSPVGNLHALLWSVPGFSFLRAPARFTYLVVFACACLAAIGLQALSQRRVRVLVALVGGLPMSVSLAALLAILPNARNWLQADPNRALVFVNGSYLTLRAQYIIDPQLALHGLLASLDFGSPKTDWSLVLMALTIAAFVAWLGLGYRRATLGQGLFVGLLALDLLTFAGDFHPRSPLTDLVATLPTGVTSSSRVFLWEPTDLPALEPDSLVANRVSSVQGYSSLPSQRYVEVETATRLQPWLTELWSAPLIVEPLQSADATTVQGVRFRSAHPLVVARGTTQPVTFRLPAARPAPTGVRLIATLNYAFAIPQGQPVATVMVGNSRVPLRAGIEVAEKAVDRPSLRGVVQHARAPVALDFEDTTAAGETYTAHLYVATLPVLAAADTTSLTITPLDPDSELDVYGLATVDSIGAVTSLDLSNRDGFQRIGPQVIENTRALPRAFVLPRTAAFNVPRPTPATSVVTRNDFDPHHQVLIEGDAAVPDAPTDTSALALPATSIDDLGPDRIRIAATAVTPSYLVLDDFYQRDWSVSVDGRRADLLIANALFRAVALDPGEHVVEFRYAPRLYLAAAAVTGLAVLALAATITFGLRRSR
ncbi:MAG: hypothetical protein NVSMB2_06570 [Chloroflexota bacterium]